MLNELMKKRGRIYLLSVSLDVFLEFILPLRSIINYFKSGAKS